MIPSTADILRIIADAARHSVDQHGTLHVDIFTMRLEQAATLAEQRDVPSERVVPWVEPRPERARHVDPAFSQGNANIGPQFLVTPKTSHKPVVE